MATAVTTARGIRTSRPSILIDGSESLRLAQGLKRMVIHESLDGLYSLEGTFGNWGPRRNSIDFLYFDRGALDFGKTIKVGLESDSLFVGRISALEAIYPEGRPPEINIFAEDRFQDLRMTRRTRTFADMTDADVIRRVAADHGLQADVEVQGPTHAVLAQVNQSDLAFLRSRTRVLGAEVWIVDTTLNAKTREQRTGQAIKLAYGGELQEFRVNADLSRQRTSLTVAGWDPKSKAAAQHEAGVNAMTGELDGRDSGASILESAFAPRRESVVHLGARSSGEAKAYAEALFRSQARAFVSGWGVCQANVGLHSGRRVELSGLGPLFDGPYFVTAVRTEFEGTSGFTTEFRVERPGLGKPN